MTNPVLAALVNPDMLSPVLEKPDGTSIDLGLDPLILPDGPGKVYTLTQPTFPKTSSLYFIQGDITQYVYSPAPGRVVGTTWAQTEGGAWTAINGVFSEHSETTYPDGILSPMLISRAETPWQEYWASDGERGSGPNKLITASGANCEIRCPADIDPACTNFWVRAVVGNREATDQSFQLTVNGVNFGFPFTATARDFGVGEYSVYDPPPVTGVTTVGVKMLNSVAGQRFELLQIIALDRTDAGANWEINPGTLMTFGWDGPSPRNVPPVTYLGTIGASRQTWTGQTLPILSRKAVGISAVRGAMAVRGRATGSNKDQDFGAGYAGELTTDFSPYPQVSGRGTVYKDGSTKLDFTVVDGARSPASITNIFGDWPSNVGFLATMSWDATMLSAKMPGLPAVTTARQSAIEFADDPVNDIFIPFGNWYRASASLDVGHTSLYTGYAIASRPWTTTEIAYLETTDSVWHPRMFAAPTSATLSPSTLIRGDDYSATLTILDEHSLGMFLPGKTVWLTIKPLTDYRTASGDTEATVKLSIVIDATGATTSSDGLAVSGDLDDGALTVTIAAAETTALNPGRYAYDVQVSGPEGLVTVKTGRCTVTADVTRRITTP